MNSSETMKTFVGYVWIGIAGVALYFGLLWIFVSLDVPYFFAFTMSYILAVSAQFLMNKYLNFRAFSRPIHHQAGTYAVMTALNYAIMIAIEEFGVHALRLGPLAAYALSIPFCLPIGYLAARFLTFGPGILGTLKRSEKL